MLLYEMDVDSERREGGQGRVRLFIEEGIQPPRGLFTVQWLTLSTSPEFAIASSARSTDEGQSASRCPASAS